MKIFLNPASLKECFFINCPEKFRTGITALFWFIFVFNEKCGKGLACGGRIDNGLNYLSISLIRAVSVADILQRSKSASVGFGHEVVALQR